MLVTICDDEGMVEGMYTLDADGARFLLEGLAGESAGDLENEEQEDAVAGLTGDLILMARREIAKKGGE